MGTERPLRVAVVSRYQLVRAGLAQLIDSDPARAVVVDVASHDGHLGHIDVAVYDLAGLAADQLVRDLQHLVGTVPVVGLARDRLEHLTAGARQLGVAGVVTEDVTAAALLDALEEAAGLEPAEAPRRHEPALLTGQERRVLQLIGEGRSNHDIAAELYLSINSVKTYVRAAYRKIGVQSRSQAVLWCLRTGLVDATPPAREDA